MSFSYPSYDEIMAADSQELFRARRAFRSIFSHMIWFFITTAIVIVANVSLSTTSGPIFSWFSPRWLAIIPVVLLLEIFRKYHDDIYVFEKHSMTHYQGILSLHSTTPALKYIDILGLCVEQDIWGRILDYGDVLLDTAGEVGTEVIMTGVRSPRELAGIIERLMSDSLEDGGVSIEEKV